MKWLKVQFMLKARERIAFTYRINKKLKKDGMEFER